MPTSSRALWKGAISFGLVHIPVSLHPAGDTESVIEPEEEPPGKSADIIDLTELLQRSPRRLSARKRGLNGARARR